LPPSTSKRLKEAENELGFATKSYESQAAELQRSVRERTRRRQVVSVEG
jgi:hypothetical protein